jgi:hypothetical protein
MSYSSSPSHPRNINSRCPFRMHSRRRPRSIAPPHPAAGHAFAPAASMPPLPHLFDLINWTTAAQCSISMALWQDWSLLVATTAFYRWGLRTGLRESAWSSCRAHHLPSRAHHLPSRGPPPQLWWPAPYTPRTATVRPVYPGGSLIARDSGGR